jgi:putative ABC transport system permease protein
VFPRSWQVRQAVRRLRHSRGFVVTTSLTLALGIGLATAVFTVAEALLLRRLPIQDQDRVVLLWGEMRGRNFINYPLSVEDARAFANSARSLQQFGFFAYEGASPTLVRIGDDMARLNRAPIVGDFFETLGAQPVIGRALSAADDARGSPPVIVLSYSAWQRHFGGDPGVLGERVTIHEQGIVYTIVGVMPQGLDWPRGTDFWAAAIPAIPERSMQYMALHVVGRLAPGATPANARDELSAFYRRPGASVYQRDLAGTVRTLPHEILGDTKPALWTFAAASALLLLITCINVANLLLVRGLSRGREVAVRLALGAKRRHIISHLLVENALLALAGGALGILVAIAAVRGFVTFAPADLPRLDEIRMNVTVLAGAVFLTALSTLLFALMPAIVASRVELQDVLRAEVRQTATRRRRLVGEGLVAVQIALALIVVLASGVVAKSLVKLERVDLALQPSRLLIAELEVRSDDFGSRASLDALLDRLVNNIEAIPGVRGTSHAVAAPYAESGAWDGRPVADGQSEDDVRTNPMFNLDVVSPKYFDVLGIPILRGRGFTDQDRADAPFVVVVSNSVAQHYWPGENPIGRRLSMGGATDTAFTVVGLVPDTRYRNLREARGSIYFPVRQPFFPFAPSTLVIGTQGPPNEVVPALRQVIGETSASVALAGVAPFDRFLDAPLAQPRLNAFLLAVFASAAAALAAIGLFGTMAAMVRQRRRELGVRMALGATRADLRRLVLGRGLTVATVGVTLGLCGALLASKFIRALLYDVSPTDATTIVLGASSLLLVALIAIAVPARSSTRVDPMDVLRADA